MPGRDMDQMTSMAVSLATPPHYRFRPLCLAAFLSLEPIQTATCNKKLFFLSCMPPHDSWGEARTLGKCPVDASLPLEEAFSKIRDMVR